jgi:hypothetical protein
VDPTQAKGRLEWGTQPLLGKEKQQVPPLRFAPVGMTNLFGAQVISQQQICHRDRSEAQWRDLLFLIA